MFTADYIRENTVRLGRGTIVETSGETFEGIEIFSGADNSIIVGVRQFAALNPEDAREDVILFPVANLRRVEILTQE